PLTSFFVMRQKSMNALIKHLVDSKTPQQHIVIVAGMGGSGKTQLALKFARDFEQSFKLIMFIDASSADTLKKGLLSRIRALGRNYSPENVEDALGILANPDDPVVRNWLIIYDNADDPDLDVQRYIPVCDTGAILITTRNTTLRHLSPEGYLELDVMSTEEAVTALLQAALPPTAKPTSRDREAAIAITRQLGHLPIAIIQAGCYIRQQQCLYEYSDMLKADRKATLERPARNQRDMLKYGHSVYAALDITLNAISERSRHLLSILSSVHFTGFPRLVFSTAAKSGFSLEVIKLVDRSQEFQTTIDFLKRIFCPSGSWSESVLAGFLEELQQYSLISLVSSTNLVTLRLHPLVHSWAQDRLSLDEQNAYRSAAVRLLACCAGPESYVLYDYLAPQIMSLSSVWTTLHSNDRIALLQILDDEEDPGDAPLVLQRARDLYEEIKAVFGERDIRTSRAALFLAKAYGGTKDDDTMERIQREAISLRESLLGKKDSETIEAVVRLGKTLVKKKLHNDAEQLLEEALNAQIEKYGESHLDTAEVMETLANAYQGQARHAEAQKLFETALNTRTQLSGDADIQAILTRLSLSKSLKGQGFHNEASVLLEEALTLENTYLGTSHIGTLLTMATTAISYLQQERFDDGERMLLQALEGFKGSQWAQNPGRLDIMEVLAIQYDELGRLADSVALRKEELALRREIQGDRAKETLDILHPMAMDARAMVAFTLHEQGRFSEAAALIERVVKERIELWDENHITVARGRSRLALCYEALGRQKEAKELAEAALIEVKSVFGERDIRTSRAALFLAEAYGSTKNEDAKERIQREVISLRESLLGKEDSETIKAVVRLGKTLVKKKLYDDAERLLDEALRMRVEKHGESNLDTAEAMESLAAAYQGQDQRFDDGERMLLQALEGFKESQWAQNPERLVVMEALALLYDEWGRPAEGIAIRKEELTLRREIQGDRAKETLDILQRQVSLYLKQGNFKDAIVEAKELAEAREAVLGDQHADTIVAYRLLASAFRGVGNYQEAEEVRRHEILLRRRLLGEEHPSVFSAIGDLARIVHAQKRHVEAETLWVESVEGMTRLLKETPNTELLNEVNDLVAHLDTEKRYEEAEDLAKGLVAGRTKVLGQDHMNTLDSLIWVGRIYTNRRKYAEAEQLWDDLLPRLKKTSGEDSLGERHLDTISILIYLSNCAFRLGRLDEAASMRERNIELRREVLGPDHISVYEGMEQLAVVYSKLQQHDAAERLAREMMEKCEAKLGHLHPMTIRSRAVVAFTLQEQGRFSEAATLIEQVLKERIGLWGENHVMVARSKSRLARSYEALGRLTEAKELAEAALIVQRKELEPDNEALVETIELLKKLDTPPGTEIPQPTLIAGPPQSTEWPSGPELIVPTPLRRPVREETIDIDGYQSPALDPQANLAPPSISSRPASPFEQRNKFGRSPNPWSMFM
ncbi:hypothetical protein M408DRAFT_67375, partial [Serendipita vermifera MAFF 305830]